MCIRDSAKVGKLLHVPERAHIPENIKEHLIVELYSKYTEVSDKNSPLEYIVLGVEGLNFLIYNDKEYLNIQCEDFSENLD